MIELGRETDGNNEICLGVRFALCIIKAQRLVCIEHCSWDGGHPLSSSFTVFSMLDVYLRHARAPGG